MAYDKNAARMVRYHESRRIGRCDRCSRKSRPGRAMCSKCAKRHQRVSDETRWVNMGVQFTYDDYNRLFKSQGGRCALCRSRPSYKRLHMDHDHKTLIVRGLLCGKCNRGIGMFNDSPELLERAVEYVATTRAKNHLTLVTGVPSLQRSPR